MKKMYAVIVFFVFWSGCSYAMEKQPLLRNNRRVDARRCGFRAAIALSAAGLASSLGAIVMLEWSEYSSPVDLEIGAAAAMFAGLGCIGSGLGLALCCGKKEDSRPDVEMQEEEDQVSFDFNVEDGPSVVVV